MNTDIQIKYKGQVFIIRNREHTLPKRRHRRYNVCHLQDDLTNNYTLCYGDKSVDFLYGQNIHTLCEELMTNE